YLLWTHRSKTQFIVMKLHRWNVHTVPMPSLWHQSLNFQPIRSRHAYVTCNYNQIWGWGLGVVHPSPCQAETCFAGGWARVRFLPIPFTQTPRNDSTHTSP